MNSQRSHFLKRDSLLGQVQAPLSQAKILQMLSVEVMLLHQKRTSRHKLPQGIHWSKNWKFHHMLKNPSKVTEEILTCFGTHHVPFQRPWNLQPTSYLNFISWINRRTKEDTSWKTTRTLQAKQKIIYLSSKILLSPPHQPQVCNIAKISTQTWMMMKELGIDYDTS